MRYRVGITTVAATIASLWLLSASPAPAGAAVSCPNDRDGRACPVGQYWCGGSCLTQDAISAREASCVGGQQFTGCGSCSCACPSGQIACGGACQAPRTCADPNRATADQCTGACGACASGYELDASGTCVEQRAVIITPLRSQERSSSRSLIEVTQLGDGNLMNLLSQSGDATTRTNVLSVDKTGVMLGWHPDPAKLGIDLGAGGGQNILYGIAKEAGMDPLLDALLLFQTRANDGTVTDRLRATGRGDLLVSGALAVGSGIRAGSGKVNIIDSAGKIPAISSAYFANLSGASVTNLNASALANGTIPIARLPSAVITEGESGASLTALNAAALASGEVPDARLPATLVRANQRTAFTAAPIGNGAQVGSLAVNPASANAGFTLFGIAVAGADRFTVQGNGDVTAVGRVVLSGAPVGANALQGSLVVNPGSASAGAPLFEVYRNGSQRFTIDAEGDVRMSGGITAGSNLRTVVDAAGDPQVPVGGRLNVGVTDSDFAYLREVTADNDNAVNLQLVLGDDGDDQELFSIFSDHRDNQFDRTVHAFTASGNARHEGNLTVRRDLAVTGSGAFGGPRLTVAGNPVLAGYRRTERVCMGATQCDVSCAANEVLLSGGCNVLSGSLRSSYPAGGPWLCAGTVNTTITAFAVCAREAR